MPRSKKSNIKPNIFSNLTSSASETLKSLPSKIRSVPQNIKPTYIKVRNFVKRRPMASFFAALGILFLAILLNSLLTPKPREAETRTSPKEVSVYRIGRAPRATFSAKADKKGVIQIVALTPGIVYSINVYEGQTVSRGTTLVNVANNYNGGSAATVQRQLAAAQYQNVIDTYDKQKSVIEGQRRAADLSLENAQDLRDITNQSISETHDLITLNASLISGIESNIQILEANNPGGINDAAILSAKGLLVQTRSANNGLYQAVRNEEIAASDTNPPAELAKTAHNIALDQLEVAQKALDLSREASGLQLKLAQIAEAAANPSAPFDGVIEKVHVTIGQSVNPGTPLVTISANNKNATLTILVQRNTAEKISKLEETTVTIGKDKFYLLPDFVSSEATDGLLYSVVYSLPEEAYSQVSDGQYVTVEVPIGYPDTISAIPFVPIDIVYQTQEGAFVYVVKNGRAAARSVNLGEVSGTSVAIEKGLAASDEVILDRTVIDGEKVKVSN